MHTAETWTYSNIAARLLPLCQSNPNVQYRGAKAKVKDVQAASEEMLVPIRNLDTNTLSTE